MRILYIVNNLDYFRAHRENIALAMAKDGHDIFVASGDCENVDITDWPANIILFQLKLNKHALDPKSDLGLMRELRAIMVRQRPDIVHAITIKPILMSALAACFSLRQRIRSKIKFVWTFAGLGKVFEPTDRPTLITRRKLVVNALRICARRINVVATFENAANRETFDQFEIVSGNRTRVLWGAGLSFAKYNSVRPNRDNQPLVFLMATRLIKEKGVDTYLETAAKFSTHPARPQFLLAGYQDPTNPDNVELADIEAADRAGHINFLGAIPEKGMPAVYNRSDVFCLPTRLQEGFPRSLLEAAACGCALIASSQPSIEQVLTDGETGFLLPTANIEELVRAVENVLRAPDLVRKMGINANKFVHDQPISQEYIVDSFKEIYSSDSID